MHYRAVSAADLQRRTAGQQSVHLRYGAGGPIRHRRLLPDGRKHLQWFRDQFGAAERAAAEQAGQNAYPLLLDQVPEEPSGLLVLPYFAPGGTPYFDMNTPGVIYGLRLSTSRGEFLAPCSKGCSWKCG